MAINSFREDEAADKQVGKVKHCFVSLPIYLRTKRKSSLYYSLWLFVSLSAS